MSTRNAISNLVKPLAVFAIASGILLFSDLDKRVVANNASDNPKDSLLRFAYVAFVNAPTLERLEKGITDGLNQKGLHKGDQYTLDSYNAQGDVSTLNTIVTSLQSENYDLIFTACTPTLQATSLKIKKTPIVFTAVTDGVAAGVGKSNEDHQSNVTGISSLSPHDKMMESIRELLPDARRLGTLYNPSEANSVFARADMEAKAKELGFELISIPANTQGEVVDAASVLCSKNIDAVCQVLDNLCASSYSSIINAANKAGIPYFSFDIPEVKDGSLLAESVDFYYVGIQGSDLAMEILDGKNPKDIPFQYGKKVIVDYNEDVAAHFNIEITDRIKKLKAESEKTALNKKVKIAYVGFSNSSPVDDAERGIRDVIKDLGWTKDITMDVFNAQSDMTVVSNIVDNIQAKPYDMVISACTPTSQAVAHKIKDRPVVFCTVADPVFAGLGESFEKHPNNITGISVLADFNGTIELIKEILPNCKKIGSLFNPAEANSVASKEHFEKACKEAGLELVTIPCGSAGEISDATLALLAKDIDAIAQIADNLSSTSYAGILKEVNKTNMP